MQAETQARLQEDDGSTRPQMQQEQQGSFVQEGVWVIDLTVDNPTASQDGEDTYMVRAALVISAESCISSACLAQHKRQQGNSCRKGLWARRSSYNDSKPLQGSTEGHILSPCVVLQLQRRCKIDVQC